LENVGLGQLQYIQMSGDPSQIFDLSFQQTIISGVDGFENFLYNFYDEIIFLLQQLSD
jgi:hypothetical protein